MLQHACTHSGNSCHVSGSTGQAAQARQASQCEVEVNPSLDGQRKRRLSTLLRVSKSVVGQRQ